MNLHSRMISLIKNVLIIIIVKTIPYRLYIFHLRAADKENEMPDGELAA